MYIQKPIFGLFAALTVLTSDAFCAESNPSPMEMEKQESRKSLKRKRANCIDSEKRVFNKTNSLDTLRGKVSLNKLGHFNRVKLSPEERQNFIQCGISKRTASDHLFIINSARGHTSSSIDTLNVVGQIYVNSKKPIKKGKLYKYFLHENDVPSVSSNTFYRYLDVAKERLNHVLPDKNTWINIGEYELDGCYNGLQVRGGFDNLLPSPTGESGSRSTVPSPYTATTTISSESMEEESDNTGGANDSYLSYREADELVNLWLSPEVEGSLPSPRLVFTTTTMTDSDVMQLNQFVASLSSYSDERMIAETTEEVFSQISSASSLSYEISGENWKMMIDGVIGEQNRVVHGNPTEGMVYCLKNMPIYEAFRGETFDLGSLPPAPSRGSADPVPHETLEVYSQSFENDRPQKRRKLLDGNG